MHTQMIFAAIECWGGGGGGGERNEGGSLSLSSWLPWAQSWPLWVPHYPVDFETTHTFIHSLEKKKKRGGDSVTMTCKMEH